VGLFWEVKHPVTGEELQLKDGYESWDDYSFQVGDDIHPKAAPEEPLCGRLLDDASLAGSAVAAGMKLSWVVIRGGEVHAADDAERDAGGALQGGEGSRPDVLSPPRGRTTSGRAQPPSRPLHPSPAGTPHEPARTPDKRLT
jgi:hypothetical protein